MSQGTWRGTVDRIWDIGRRQAEANGAGAERFLVKKTSPMKLESFHDDTVLHEGDDDFDIAHAAADADVGDTVMVITDRNGARIAVGKITP